jgi:preprotein translocase subunit YajC
MNEDITEIYIGDVIVTDSGLKGTVTNIEESGLTFITESGDIYKTSFHAIRDKILLTG